MPPQDNISMTLMMVKMEDLQTAVSLLAKIMVRRYAETSPDDPNDFVGQLSRLVDTAQQHLDTLCIARLRLEPVTSERCDVAYAQPVQDLLCL
jgi:hypothetical protein